ncbi:MAG: LPS export ABC transporter permease LptF [Rhodospirillaceae bacterium]|jgi:lipopolysaccharide export system permease protein|nr:LPS export ABC transporter permease LptF [Rhodospirillaceae bacterium]MBT5244211.1 LPS export ABC transporter permease LptF [Rhodospirillaceae bacterium]MBT5561736.1 LPS export ABC transporter permease LptF [Rhodospirillaceae bacterium]MBT6243175.1 LPS export ABC transporter permease LptF [Rhodospirillaceae bacterium]MBT7137432.1 LPS export ABC transporter permease LptF [Rhodospirillaceae bacterium]
MSGLNKYVLKQLLVGMILVTAGLTCVIWLTQSLKFVEMIVNRGLTTGVFMYFTMLLLPNFLSIVLPIALFTVIVFTYSKLITDREMVVMRAAGLSQHALAKPGLILTFIVVILGYLINIYLLPHSYRMFRELQWEIRNSYTHILLQEGAFNEASEDIIVYIRKRSTDGQLHGILVHDGRDKNKPYTLLAERGAMLQGEEGSRVVMYNGNRQEVDPDTHQFSILYFDRYIFEMAATSNSNAGRFREARERTVYELFNLDKDPDMLPRNVGKFTVEGHKRLISPISALGYALVGLAILISSSFSRRTQSRRIVLAAVIVVTLQAAMLALENATAKNLSLVPALYVLGLLPVFAGYLLMLKSPKTRATRRFGAAG